MSDSVVEDTPQERYDLVKDSYGRWRTDISPSISVGIKLLSEDHERRIAKRVHAFGVIHLQTELGPWFIRDVSIVYNPRQDRFQVFYRQWKTGQWRDDREEWLDVAGPVDRETRRKVQERILAVFTQIKEDAAAGILGRPQLQHPARHEPAPSTISDGQSPDVVANLESLKADLEAGEVTEGGDLPNSEVAAE